MSNIYIKKKYRESPDTQQDIYGNNFVPSVQPPGPILIILYL